MVKVQDLNYNSDKFQYIFLCLTIVTHVNTHVKNQQILSQLAENKAKRFNSLITSSQ